MHKNQGARSTVDMLASDNLFFNFILPASIDNPNNFEIVRLIRLVVSEIFLLLPTVSLIYFFFFFILILFLVNLSKLDIF